MKMNRIPSSKQLYISLFLPLALAGFAFSMPASAQAAETIHVSKNWSGYAATGDEYTGISASWIVPTSTGSNDSISADAEWVGIGGLTEHDLIQAGTQAIIQGGQVSYSAWYETLPDVQKEAPLMIHPGDQMSVSVRETAQDIWNITIADSTTGQTYQNILPYASSYSSAEWIVERPLAITDSNSGYLPLSDFGTVSFTDAIATTHGIDTSLSELDPMRYLMNSAGTRLVAAPETASDHSSFSVSYLSSSESSAYLRQLRRTYRVRSQPSTNAMQKDIGNIDPAFVVHIVF